MSLETVDNEKLKESDNLMKSNRERKFEIINRSDLTVIAADSQNNFIRKSS